MLAFICICCSDSLYKLLSNLCCCCAKHDSEINTKNILEENPVGKPLVARNYT